MFGAVYVMPGTSSLYAVQLALGEVNLVIKCGVFRFIHSRSGMKTTNPTSVPRT